MALSTSEQETTSQLRDYYANLLIYQYVAKPKAYATIQATANVMIMPQTSVQTISFSAAPATGAFVLQYNGVNTASIPYTASAATIQSDLQAISGLGSVTVSGSIAGQLLTVTFTGVTPIAAILAVPTNTTGVTISVTEVDEILPLAVQNGFNLIAGTTIAVGAQLDILGKYVGVSRTGFGFTQQITLDDADFLQLIRMAIAKNSSGSSLATIQQFMFDFFNGQVLVYDHTNMTMTYIVSQTIGSQDLFQLFITEGLLPKPMGVLLTTFYPPNFNLFVFSGATQPVPPIGGGMTTAQSPDLTGHWLLAQDLIM